MPGPYSPGAAAQADALRQLSDAVAAVTAAATATVANDSLWDAAGDLALGTGPNTAAKLVIGTTGQRLAVRGGTAAWEDEYQWVNFILDGAGSAITTGQKGHFVVPAGTIVEARLLADQVGSIVVDLWRDSYANHPPAVGDSICAAAKPTIAAATKATDAVLTGWSPICVDGDEIAVQVDSCATCQRVTLALKVRRA